MSKSPISRRQFFEISAASAASAIPGMAREAQPGAAKQPNIILFMPDELRADALACLGNPVVKTPNFDHLAAEGALFSNCFVQFPVCGASRCSLLTGWPTSVRGHRSLFYFLRPHEPNLFKYLKEGGYDVYWYGKNDALAAESFPASATEWDYYGAGGPAEHITSPRNPWPIESPHHYSFLYGEGGDRRETRDYINVQAAVRILERQEQERPFCIFLPLSFPHPPYTAPAGFYDLYAPASVPAPLPPGLPRKPNFHEGIRRSYNLEPLSERDFRKIHAVYLGMVSYSDWLLGELLETVERTGHGANTAVFVLSDHGDYTGDYGLVEKWPSGLEDVLTHVPLIARVPGMTGGRRVAGIVELFDVMATCLELAGIEARHTHFARSLVPQLHGPGGDPERAAFAEAGYNTYEPQCFEVPTAPGQIYYPKTHLQLTQPEMVTRAAMIRTRDYKLVLRPQGQSELYDYREDAHELHNRYGESSVASIQTDLERRLLEWYLTTTGIAPRDKDQRNLPPFYPTPKFS